MDTNESQIFTNCLLITIEFNKYKFIQTETLKL
jgi:hypothetical protein